MPSRLPVQVPCGLTPPAASDDARTDAATSASPVWTRTWFWVLLAALATAPYLAASIPPLEDFGGHVGRYHIMLDGGRSPDLQRYYSFHWRLIGNLGVDLLMTLVGPLLGAERGAWLISALSHAAMVLGLFAVSRAAHGRVQPTAFLALPFVYALAFSQGFLNYDLAAALALLALALWIAMRERGRLRALLFVPLAAALWICHAVGWGLAGLLIGGYECQAAVRKGGWALAALRRAIVGVAPLTPPALLSVFASPGGHPPAVILASAPHSAASYVAHKIAILLFQFAGPFVGLDLLAILLTWSVFAALLLRGGSIAPSLGAPAALLGLAVILMPPIALGVAQADMRLAPMFAVVLLLSVRSDLVRGSPLVVMLALALSGVRLAATAEEWRRADTSYAHHLAALQEIPTGARILALVPTEGGLTQAEGPPLRHLADLAVVRRDAFVNSQFAVAGAQPLEVKANTDSPFHIDPSEFVAQDRIRQALAGADKGHFDYAWVLGRYPPGPTPANLVPIFTDDETQLFRVVR